MNESSKSYLRNENFAKTLGANAKKILNKDNFKTHTKTFSMDIKHEKSKSPIQTIKSINNLNEILKGNLSNNSKLNSSQNILSNLAKNSQNNSKTNLIHQNSNYRTTKTSNLISNNSNSNVIGDRDSSANKSPAGIASNNTNPNNNINSYTTNGNVKSEINLRNYLMNRMTKSSGKPNTSHNKANNINGRVPGHGHIRSNSNNLFS